MNLHLFYCVGIIRFMLSYLNESSVSFASAHIAKLENILQTQSQKEVELVVVGNETIQEYNKEYRNIDKTTDVLSFPMETEEGDFAHLPLGSIVISSDYVTQGAQEFGHSPEDELSLLFIHGLLHLLGMDHEIDKGEMRAKEADLIAQFSLPKSLIVRNDG